MREIRIGHGCPNVTLGHAGENGVAQLMMDASDWESEFPGGALNLFMERADGARYNAAVERTEAGWAHTHHTGAQRPHRGAGNCGGNQ